MNSSETTTNNLSQDKVIPRNLKIAIDGPAGAGKSTVAHLVAQKLNYLYIDTGAMYRAVTWLALEKNVDLQDGLAIASTARKSKIKLAPGCLEPGQTVAKPRVFVDDHDVTRAIREPRVGELVSPVSAFSAVRKLLVEQQQELAADGGVVLDGRDIGTVVMPDADVKIFLTASPEERARRRLKDEQAMGRNPVYEELLAAINERDYRDSNRPDSPLKQADDAKLLITDKMTIDQVVDEIIRLCRETE